MDVNVRLHATLRRPTSDGYQNRLTVKLDEEATVASLLEAIGMDQDADHLMILVGRRRVDPGYRLESNDQVDLFPPISGGSRLATGSPGWYGLELLRDPPDSDGT